MKHVIFTPDRDQSGNDFTGAFSPESFRYTSYWQSQGDEVFLRTINPTLPAAKRIAAMLETLDSRKPVDRFVCFCHGWKTGIQMGLSSTNLNQLKSFAEALVNASTPELKVALYACSTGSSDGPPGDGGDGGFADALRDALCAAGRTNVTVFAHTTAGHTTRNEYVRFFAGTTDPLGAEGGDDVVQRKTEEFKKLATRLHNVQDNLRWRLPYMTPEQIHAELQ